MGTMPVMLTARILFTSPQQGGRGAREPVSKQKMITILWPSGSREGPVCLLRCQDPWPLFPKLDWAAQKKFSLQVSLDLG